MPPMYWLTDVQSGAPVASASPHPAAGADLLLNRDLNWALAQRRAGKTPQLMCPIAHAPLCFPVQLTTWVHDPRGGLYRESVSYEREAVCAWLDRALSSPLTGLALCSEARIVANVPLATLARLTRGEPPLSPEASLRFTASCLAWRPRGPARGSLPRERRFPDIAGREASASSLSLWLSVLVGLAWLAVLGEGHDRWSIVSAHLAIRTYDAGAFRERMLVKGL